MMTEGILIGFTSTTTSNPGNFMLTRAKTLDLKDLSTQAGSTTNLRTGDSSTDLALNSRPSPETGVGFHLPNQFTGI
jgi:hypothetical protein